MFTCQTLDILRLGSICLPFFCEFMALQLQVSALGFARGKQQVLTDISYQFAPGLHYLLGANGSGKSTLLQCLAGLLPFDGLVTIGGQDARGFSAKQLAREIAWVPQRLAPVFPIDVESFVCMGRFPYLHWLGNYRKSDLTHTENAIAILGLGHLSRRRIDHLSGGEWQKVRLAQALVQDTPIILLDEPTQALDPLHQKELHDLLAMLGNQGKILVCATHDLRPILTDEIPYLALRQGKVVQTGIGIDDEAKFIERVYSDL